MQFIIYSCVVLVASIIICAVIIKYNQKRITDAYSPLGLLFCYLFPILLLGTSLSWCIALLPPFNDPAAPVFTGIGGDAYGLMYELYPLVSLLLVAVTFVALLCALGLAMLLPRRIFNAFRGDRDIRLNSVDIMSRLCLLASSLMFVGYFSVYGWSRIWFSPLTRFEGKAVVTYFFLDPRVFQLGWLMLGVICVIQIYKSGFKIKSTISLLLVLTPLMIISSRLFTVIVSMVFCVGYFRINPRRKKLYVLLCIMPLIITAILPLRSRSYPATGLVAIYYSFNGIFFSNRHTLLENSSGLLQNLGQGYPVFVTAYDYKLGGANIMDNLPMMYKLLSFSPFPSFIDGYANNYHQYRNMLNASTPFNAYSELYSISVFLLFACPAFVLCIFCLAARSTWGSGLYWIYFSLILIFGFIGFNVYSLQYLLRQSSRYFFYSITFWAAGMFILTLMGQVRNRSNQNKRQSTIR